MGTSSPAWMRQHLVSLPNVLGDAEVTEDPLPPGVAFADDGAHAGGNGQDDVQEVGRCDEPEMHGTAYPLAKTSVWSGVRCGPISDR